MKSAKKTIALAAAMLLAAIGLALAQNYRIDWSNTDSGGALQKDSVDGQSQVSGTAGQWDATEPRANSGTGCVMRRMNEMSNYIAGSKTTGPLS